MTRHSLIEANLLVKLTEESGHWS